MTGQDEYLVRIEVAIPPTMAAEELATLMDAERTYGRGLLDAGTIQHIWRLPGGLRNVAIWRARDATELHDALASLPTYRYCSIEVQALAKHPLNSLPGDLSA
jgi:muconolactone D-isomerase